MGWFGRWGARAPEARAWGLGAPIRLRGEGLLGEVEGEDPRDLALGQGWLAAHLDMPGLDLRRRLWSGRLAELLGDRVVPQDDGRGPGLVAIDLLVRTLGLREYAEGVFRRADAAERSRCEGWARGANAWIDDHRWREDPVWAALGSRPRLWGPADCFLQDAATHLIDEVMDPISAPVELAAVFRAWDALRSSALRAPGAPGGGGSRSPLRRQVVVVPEEVMPGDDQQRLADGARWVRLRARRIDLVVRGEPPRRRWLRRSPRGPLVGDRLHDDGSVLPPTGPSWSWAMEDLSTPDPAREPWPALPIGHPFLLLPPRPPKPSWRLRLVPLT